jgi:hypothetical protein
MIGGSFQFFYSSRARNLPNPDIPTRDVTNTAHAGNKTEPFLERRCENWCRCRAQMVTAAVRDAESMVSRAGKHFLVLTTRHPHTGRHYAVGLMEYSSKASEELRSSFRGRWRGYKPYVADHCKLVSFKHAYELDSWMKNANTKYMPGKRYGRVKAPLSLLRKIVEHFASLSDETDKFLSNVCFLERILKNNGHSLIWSDYEARVNGRSPAKCAQRKSGC